MKTDTDISNKEEFLIDFEKNQDNSLAATGINRMVELLKFAQEFFQPNVNTSIKEFLNEFDDIANNSGSTIKALRILGFISKKEKKIIWNEEQINLINNYNANVIFSIRSKIWNYTPEKLTEYLKTEFNQVNFIKEEISWSKKESSKNINKQEQEKEKYTTFIPIQPNVVDKSLVGGILFSLKQFAILEAMESVMNVGGVVEMGDLIIMEVKYVEFKNPNFDKKSITIKFFGMVKHDIIATYEAHNINGLFLDFNKKEAFLKINLSH